MLVAALDELISTGYAELTVEAIAARADVNKTTIYRRWSTLEDLLVDALATWAVDIPVPDTGDIETDLLEIGRELAALLNSGIGRQVATFVLTAGLRSTQLREATRRYFHLQAVRAIPVVGRAVDRGELPSNCDAEVLLTTFRAPFFYRLVTTGDEIDEDLIALSVRIALTAARAGLLSS